MTSLTEWITAHRCRYEIHPVVELEHGEASQVGFEISVHAELPVGDTITAELGKEMDAIRDRLGEILESLIPSDPKAHIQRVPFRRAVRFLRGAGKSPVVTRALRVFHPDYAAVQLDDRKKFGPTEKRFAELGIKKA